MKKLMIFTVVGLFALSFNTQNSFAQTGVAPSLDETDWLNGSWTGIGVQPGALNQVVWEIVLSYDTATKKILISYPTFPCSGYWELQRGDKQKAIFIERITEGKDKCQDANTVVLTRINENYVTISYFYPSMSDALSSFSTLTKVK